MNIIVLQHIKIEDPGYIKDLMLADGVKLTTIELDEGEKIPNNLNQFDGMFCMGGPMDTYMEKEYPWLIEEKKAIKEFVINLKKPYLGFCLGCQLLGEVVGGKVVKSNPAEIGIMDINFSEKKNQNKLFSKFPKKIKHLILVSSTPCFINKKEWNYGVEKDIFEKFASQLLVNWKKTIHQFFLLQLYGEPNIRKVTAKFEETILSLGKPDPRALKAGLKLLMDTDCRENLININVKRDPISA